jgi:hypothetical protein
MDISGGGTASTVPWGGITNLPDAFKQEPLSANASFDNAYKGGVTIDTNGGTTVTCEVGSWGNSGVWDNTPIVNNGVGIVGLSFRLL